MKTLVHTLVLFTLVASTGSLTACRNNQEPPAVRGDTVTSLEYPKITAEGGLNEYVRFGEPVVMAGSEARPMRVTVPVRSTWERYPLNVQYRFEFYNDRNQPLQSNQDWRYTVLEPGIQTHFEATAIEGTARNWRLIMRPAK